MPCHPWHWVPAVAAGTTGFVAEVRGIGVPNGSESRDPCRFAPHDLLSPRPNGRIWIKARGRRDHIEPPAA